MRGLGRDTGSLPKYNMKVKIHDIPLEGLDLTSDQDSWFGDLVRETFSDDFKGTSVSLHLHLQKTCDNISLDGEAVFSLEPLCDRCAEKFALPIHVPLHLNVVPKEEAFFEDEGANQEDENVSYYQGHDIDLNEILRETILLAVPYRKLCQESCKGLCPQCGQNLNLGSCSCKEQKTDPRFSVLKTYKAQ